MKNLLIILTLSIFGLAIFSIDPVVAQTGYQPLAPVPELGIKSTSGENISEFLQTMFKVLISITGVLAVLMIVIGGIQYMTTDAVFGKELGKQRIQAAIGGLILALASWIILSTINTDLIRSDLSLSEYNNANIQNDSNSLNFGELRGVEVPDTTVVSGGAALFDNHIGIGELDVYGTDTSSGRIITSHFGGPKDIRITEDFYALHYCNRPYGGNIGDFYETTHTGSSWCYALNSQNQKIRYPNGRRDAFGGYFETTSVSGERFSELRGLYIAYPLSGIKQGRLPVAPANNVCVNNFLRKHNVVLILSNGQKTLPIKIADRGPERTIDKLDLSPSLSNIVKNGGGLDDAYLINSRTQEIVTEIPC